MNMKTLALATSFVNKCLSKNIMSEATKKFELLLKSG